MRRPNDQYNHLKHLAHIQADDELHKAALALLVRGGALQLAVEALREGYRINFQDYDPTNWRRVGRLRMQAAEEARL